MNQSTQSNLAHGAQAPHTGPGDDPHYAYDSDMLPCKLERRSRRDGRSRSKALKVRRANKRTHADAWERGDGDDAAEEHQDDDAEEKDHGVAEAHDYDESELGDYDAEDEDEDDSDGDVVDGDSHIATNDGEDAGEGRL